MRIGLQIPHFRPSTPATMRRWLRETAQAVDQGNFDSLWVMDHFFQLGRWLGEPESEMIEGYTTLGYLAGVTERVKLGLLVGGVIYRHPALVIKMVSTLDVLSGGRLYFGIGAAWYEHETLSLGMHFPPIKERFERLEEILQIARHMWSGNPAPLEGKYTTMPKPINNPQPLSQPHPPIMIGGMGPTKTLRFVAQYADACNFFGGSEESLLRDRLDLLQQYCAELGRPFAEIEKTILETVDLDETGTAAIIERGKFLQRLGFEHIIFNLKGAYTSQALEQLNQVILPALKEQG